MTKDIIVSCITHINPHRNLRYRCRYSLSPVSKGKAEIKLDSIQFKDIELIDKLSDNELDLIINHINQKI